MIVGFTLEKAKELNPNNFTESAQKLESIPIDNLRENLTTEQVSFILNFIENEAVEAEVKLLLLYFCAKSGFCKLSLLLYNALLFTPLRTRCETDTYLSAWSAYLGDRICDILMGWRFDDKPVLDTAKICEILIVQAELVEFLIFLSDTEKRAKLLTIWENAYRISRISEEVNSENCAEISMQLAKNCYENYFAIPAYGNLLDRANTLFEEAIRYRVLDQTTEVNIHNEIITRLTYSRYLAKVNDISSIEKVLAEAIEKLELKKSVFQRKSLYYQNYLCCLDLLRSVHNYKKQNDQENNYEHYESKAQNILEEIQREGIEENNLYEQESTAQMIIEKFQGNLHYSQEDFQNLMPKEFFMAKSLMNRIVENAKELKENFKFENIFNAIPEELKRYFMLHDITRRIYRSIFDSNYSNEQSVEFFYATVLWYFQGQRQDLFIRQYEIEQIKDYALSNLESDDSGLYYTILFLSCFELTTLREPSFRRTFLDVIRSLYRYLTANGRSDDFRKISNMLQKLPWYAQQFRTIKSPELLAIYNGMLHTEIQKQNQNQTIHDHYNIFAVWDNLLSDVEIISCVRPYPPGHVFYKWQFLVELVIQLEKRKREFIGDSLLNSSFREFFLHQAKMSVGLGERMGVECRDQLIEECYKAPNLLKFLHEKELEIFNDFYFEEKRKDDLFWFWRMSSAPFFPSDYSLASFQNDFYHSIKTLLKNDKVISLSVIAINYDTGDHLKLVSTVMFLQNDETIFSTFTTDLSLEDQKSIEDTAQNISVLVTQKVISHFSKLYTTAIRYGKKNLVWLGMDILKLFPIHILPIDTSSELVWLDAWNTIEFANSLRELMLPRGVSKFTEKYPQKPTIPTLRMFGESKQSDFYPSLGKRILDNLVEIDSSPVIHGKPISFNDIVSSEEMRLECIPTVISYYGHIGYGSYLEEKTGFLTDNEISNLNYILSSPEIGGTQRIDLWGCHGATVFAFDSLDLPRYENFAERFLKKNIKQILVTIKEVPDFAIALLWEYISLNERVYPEKTISIILRGAILWYRSSILDLCDKVQIRVQDWLSSNKNFSLSRVEKELHPFVRKVVTEETNNLRTRFRDTLPKQFPFHKFEEQDIDCSLLKHGEACYLGRKNNPEQKQKLQNHKAYAKSLIDNIFSEFKTSRVWGSIIFINTAMS